MAKPRKPTHLHLVQGTLRKHRHGDRENEPEVLEPLGGPPESWNAAGKLLWAELADMLPDGVATKADRLMFETLVRLVAQMRQGPETFTPALATQVRMSCAVFGMTPADRSRVTAVQSPAINPFARL